MKTTLTAKYIWLGVLGTVDLFFVHPSINLLYVMFGAIAFDFVTGFAKAKFKKQQRTSEGFRRTLVKILQYIPSVAIYVAAELVPGQRDNLQKVAGWITMFILYIEITSIMENLYEIDSKSKIAKYVYRPALRILKLGLENNAIEQAASKLRTSAPNDQELKNKNQ